MCWESYPLNAEDGSSRGRLGHTGSSKTRAPNPTILSALIDRTDGTVQQPLGPLIGLLIRWMMSHPDELTPALGGAGTRVRWNEAGLGVPKPETQNPKP